MQTLRVDSNESVYAVDKYIVVIGGNVRPGFWHHKDWSYLVVERPMLALPFMGVETSRKNARAAVYFMRQADAILNGEPFDEFDSELESMGDI
jgi:hypothetical protein